MSRRLLHVALAYTLGSASFVLLFALLWLCDPARPAYAQSDPLALGSIRGTVRNGAGDPLANITVTLELYRNLGTPRTLTSNSRGEFEFLSVPSANYALHFADPAQHYAGQYYTGGDFADEAVAVTVNGDHVSGVDMTMTAAGAISVTLNYARPFSVTRQTVALYHQTKQGAWRTYGEVQLHAGDMATRFSGLPAGSYRVCVTSESKFANGILRECYDNILPESRYDLAPAATAIAVQSGAESALAITLGDMPQVEGTIFGPDHQPLAGIDLFLYQSFNLYSYTLATTDEHGYFALPYIQSGLYRLTLNAPINRVNDYLPLYFPNGETGETAEEISIDAATRLSVTRQLGAAARLVGKLTLPNNVPLQNVGLTAYRDNGGGNFGHYSHCLIDSCANLSRYDPATGIYTVTQLIPGTYRLAIGYSIPGPPNAHGIFYGGDSLEQADNIVVGRGETKRLVDLVVEQGRFDSAISGRVLANGAGANGAGVGQIEVGLFATTFDVQGSALPLLSTVTDAQGRYTLQGLERGAYLVGFRDPTGRYATTFYRSADYAPQYEPFGSTLVLTGTGTLANIDVILSPGATIQGRIRANHDAPHGGFILNAIEQKQEYFDPFSSYPVPYVDVQSDAAGAFAITGLPPGIYYLRATVPEDFESYLTGNQSYYPGTFDYTRALTVTVAEGETVTGRDIIFFGAPAVYLPAINVNATPVVIAPGFPPGPDAALDPSATP